MLIVGGGCAGITVAHLLRRRADPRLGLRITILEPSPVHHYQPGWTLVGGGLMDLVQTRRDEASLIPAGVRWLRAAATGFDPQARLVRCSDGQTLAYDALVMATGLACRWDRIQGLGEALGLATAPARPEVCSNYLVGGAVHTWEVIQRFQGGTALFTMPDTPVKCGGAPQKVMYMADDHFKARSGVGVNSRVIFCTPLPSLFSVSAYARTLRQVAQQRGIEVRHGWTLRELRPAEQLAIFDVREGDSLRTGTIPYAMLHAVPPMTAPAVVVGSPLADGSPGGWVAADRDTLQHPVWPEVFALGDVAGLPTSKTAGAVRAEAPVVAANVLAQLHGRPLPARYDGYTVCPLITGYGRVVMAEFDYSQQPVSSFLVDPTRERWSMWLVKTRLLPWLYWNRMLPGEPHEGRLLQPLQPLVHALALDYRHHSPSEAEQQALAAGSC